MPDTLEAGTRPIILPAPRFWAPWVAVLVFVTFYIGIISSAKTHWI